MGKGIGIKAYFGDTPPRHKKQKSEQEIAADVWNSMRHRWQEALELHGGNMDPSQVATVFTEIFSQPYQSHPTSAQDQYSPRIEVKINHLF